MMMMVTSNFHVCQKEGIHGDWDEETGDQRMGGDKGTLYG